MNEQAINVGFGTRWRICAWGAEKPLGALGWPAGNLANKSVRNPNSQVSLSDFHAASLAMWMGKQVKLCLSKKRL